MKRIKEIVISSTPPSTQDLWITNDNQLKFFGPNGWTSIVFKSTEEKNDSNKEEPDNPTQTTPEVPSVPSIGFGGDAEDGDEAD